MAASKSSEDIVAQEFSELGRSIKTIVITALAALFVAGIVGTVALYGAVAGLGTDLKTVQKDIGQIREDIKTNIQAADIRIDKNRDMIQENREEIIELKTRSRFDRPSSEAP